MSLAQRFDRASDPILPHGLQDHAPTRVLIHAEPRISAAGQQSEMPADRPQQWTLLLCPEPFDPRAQ